MRLVDQQRQNRKRGDCVVRALTALTEFQYRTWEVLLRSFGYNHVAGIPIKKTLLVLKKIANLKHLRFHKYPTITQLQKKYPNEKLLARFSYKNRGGHMFAIINGVVYDWTHKYPRKRVHEAWILKNLV